MKRKVSNQATLIIVTLCPWGLSLGQVHTFRYIRTSVILWQTYGSFKIPDRDCDYLAEVAVEQGDVPRTLIFLEGATASARCASTSTACTCSIPRHTTALNRPGMALTGAPVAQCENPQGWMISISDGG